MNMCRDLEQELDRYVKILIEHYHPERILIFGSMASGEATEESDIDLIVIKTTSKPFLKRIEEVIKLLRPRVALDILVYTPEEFEALSKNRLFFQKEILPKAREIYNARRSKGMAEIS